MSSNNEPGNSYSCAKLTKNNRPNCICDRFRDNFETVVYCDISQN